MKTSEAQRRIALFFDRRLNQEKDARRVEWLTVLLIVGLLVCVGGAYMGRTVRQAQQTALMSTVRTARLTVEIAAAGVWTELKPAPDGAVNYVLGADPGEDDENGAALRAALAGYAPAVSRQVLGRGGLDETLDALATDAAAGASAAPVVFRASQQDGVFRLEYWKTEAAYWKAPDAPDSVFTAQGPADENNAGLAGEFDA